MSELTTVTMQITKASFDKEHGLMRFRMVGSDTGEDVYEERTSVELFKDFCYRIDNGLEVPVPFKSILQEKSGWSGGVPYVSVSHYKSGKDGLNIPADVEKVYVDGDMLKATAICRDTPLGNAVFKALKEDLENKSETKDKIRVSIGFLDLKHSHGDFIFTRSTLEKSCPMCDNGIGDKVYLSGQLVHLALTRRPANPRTSTEVDKMAIKTREEDAESIVGKELAEELEVNKSALDVEDILTVKAVSAPMGDEEEMPADHTGKDGCTCKACASKKVTAKSEVEQPVVEPAVSEVVAPVTKSAFEQALDSLRDEVVAAKSLPRESALQSVQVKFDLVAKAIQDEFPAPPAPQEVVASIDPAMATLLEQIKSSVDGLAGVVSNLTTDVAILKSQTAVVQPASPDKVVAPRNLPVERAAFNMDLMAQKPLSIKELALRSVQAQ